MIKMALVPQKVAKLPKKHKLKISYIFDVVIMGLCA
jgi:hypothetical protein